MERNLAVLIDFENIATGCEKEGLGRFDTRIVMRRLKDKGRISVARSYADWGRWNRFKLDLVHEGITMVELTSHGMQSKNRADIALAVDAMELAFTRSFVDTFVILSGDSDFTPLVMRLKELNKRVIGCGTRGSTSRLIAETCDEFFFYDTLRNESRLEPLRPAKPVVVAASASAAAAPPPEEEDEGLTLDEAFELLVETLENHQRDEPAPVHASVLKASMKRKEPTFSEVELGMRTFGRFLETAAQKGLVTLSKDERAGGVRVDLPQSAQDEVPQARPVPTRTLGPEARRLQGLLAEAGLEIGEPRERRIVVEQFVATCAERARRNRSCAIQFVLGDILRRTKQEAPEIAPRTVKAVTHALLRAGLLIHPNGEAARATTAPFVAPESGAQLLDELHAAGLRSLVARGENPDDAVLTELFMGNDGEAPAGEPSGEPAPKRAETPKREPAPKREDRGGEARGDRGGEARNGEARGGEARGGRREEPRGERPERREEPRAERADRRDDRGGRKRDGRRSGEAPAELGWPEVHPAALALVASTASEPLESDAEVEPVAAAEGAAEAPVASATEAPVASAAEAPRSRRGRGAKKAPMSAPEMAEALPVDEAPPAEATEAAEPDGEAPTDGEAAEGERKRRRRGGRRGRRPAGATEETPS